MVVHWKGRDFAKISDRYGIYLIKTRHFCPFILKCVLILYTVYFRFRPYVLTFCSQSSLRSSLCGEILSHSSSKSSNWLTAWMLGRPPSITWLGSTVSSFTLQREDIELVRTDSFTALTHSEHGCCLIREVMLTAGSKALTNSTGWWHHDSSDIMHGKRWLLTGSVNVWTLG